MQNLTSILSSINGIDVSQNHTIKTAQHIGKEPDNLYRLDEVEFESLDFIYAEDIFNKTKFYLRLYHEWLNKLKKEGYLIIKLIPNKILSAEKAEKYLKRFGRDNIKIIEIKKDDDQTTFIIQKIRNLLKENDDINKWTFGIITNGKRNDFMETIIKSIHAQKIPNYEIIVCGTYFDRKEPNFRYIHFAEKDDLGWITRKKNIICENAKYENLCIIHDRVVFQEGWFEAMKKYGNYFENLGCVQLTEEGKRAGDWITHGGNYEKALGMAHLEYRDWDKWIFLLGSLTILKKSIFEKVKWDENRFWDEQEDFDLSLRMFKNGYFIDFNPDAKCLALTFRLPGMPTYKFNREKLGGIKVKNPRSLGWATLRFLAQNNGMRKIIMTTLATIKGRRSRTAKVTPTGIKTQK